MQVRMQMRLQFEETQERLRREKECMVCMEREISVAFVPCGHLVCCAGCSNQLTECPSCRSHITQCLTTYGR